MRSLWILLFFHSLVFSHTVFNGFIMACEVRGLCFWDDPLRVVETSSDGVHRPSIASSNAVRMRETLFGSE